MKIMGEVLEILIEISPEIYSNYFIEEKVRISSMFKYRKHSME